MQLPRSIGLVDLGILTVVFVMIVLPPREMYAAAAHEADAAEQFALALAEARTMAEPQDGRHLADYTRRLGEAGFEDWAIEAAVVGAERAKGAPSEWRALIAASTAYVDRLEVVLALEYANRALTACDATGTGCPKWEEIRMRLYQQHLDAGVASRIDPKLDPMGFRRAADNALRTIRLNSAERERAPAPPATPAE